MEQYEQVAGMLALAMGASWASGLNLYAALLALGLGANHGLITLPPGLEMLGNPMVIAAAGFMYCVEFFADKMPGVDTGWDTLHTFIRIPAGALLAAGAVGEINDPALEMAAAVIGGGVTAMTHATKAGSRMLINTSPEPVSNWMASITEDLSVFGGLWLALNYPWAFLAALLAFLIMLLWLLPKIWRGIKQIFAAIFRIFQRDEPPPSPAEAQLPAPK